MSDFIATFPLRGASDEELGLALARTYAEYNAWHGQSRFVADFAGDARVAGVDSVVAERIRQSLDLAESMGVIVKTETKPKSNAEIAAELAKHQLVTADLGVMIAAIVTLHNAYERFLWRLVRFGLVGNRLQVIEWIGKRKVSIAVLAAHDSDFVIDEQIENWWSELERESLPKKWDRLVGLVGFPEKLHDGIWSFDRELVSRFDEVRHNAVHHDGKAINLFDFDDFARQLWRAQLGWILHIAIFLNVQIPGEILYSAPTR